VFVIFVLYVSKHYTTSVLHLDSFSIRGSVAELGSTECEEMLMLMIMMMMMKMKRELPVTGER
jgi:hypothetical protein